MDASRRLGVMRRGADLRVVDASLFPVVPCADTKCPTLTAAEKIADAMVKAG